MHTPTHVALTSSQASPDMVLSAPRIPKKTIKAIKEAGAKVTLRESIYLIEIARSHDPASCKYEEFLENIGEKHPWVSCTFAPPPGFPILPAEGWKLMAEVSSLVQHYAPLHMGAFAPGPPPPPPPPAAGAVGAAAPVYFHNAKLSGHRLNQLIQTHSNAATHPILSALPVGCYVATVQQMWAGMWVTTVLVRAVPPAVPALPPAVPVVPPAGGAGRGRGAGKKVAKPNS